MKGRMNKKFEDQEIELNGKLGKDMLDEVESK